jgi:chromatin-remodeling ATPase INO80
VNQNKKLADAA